MRKRGVELDAIFKRLYENWGLGHLSVEPFQTLSSGYTEEQARLVVHEKSTKWSEKSMQTIEIHYNDIGCIGEDIPQDKESPRQEISA